MTSLLQSIAVEHKALIVGNPIDDPSGLMYEDALEIRNIPVTWIPLDDVLGQLFNRAGTSLRTVARQNPHAVDVHAEDFAFAADAEVRSDYTCVIDVSTDADPYRTILCRLFDDLGLQQFNSVESVADAQDKWLTHVRLRDAGLPVPKAALVTSVTEAKIEAAALGYPVVVKVLEGTRGSGVRLARDEPELVSCVEELEIDRLPLMLEQYIECDARDKRLIVIGNKFVNAIGRSATVEGEFRANIALGGSVTSCHLSDDETALAERASVILGMRLAGLDMSVVTEMLPGREGLPVGSSFFIEANPAPAMVNPRKTSGVNGAELIVGLLVD